MICFLRLGEGCRHPPGYIAGAGVVVVVLLVGGGGVFTLGRGQGAVPFSTGHEGHLAGRRRDHQGPFKAAFLSSAIPWCLGASIAAGFTPGRHGDLKEQNSVSW